MNVFGRERFLKAIAERISPERIEEVHLFPALRQGGKETGVAVIAVQPEPLAVEPPAPEGTTDTPSAELQAEDQLPLIVDELAAAEEPSSTPAEEPVTRFTIYRAHYRLTLKGVDRGKWEIDVTEEADAPAHTVDEVVRGVHVRAGGEDVPERLSGEAFRTALTGEMWTAPR